MYKAIITKYIGPTDRRGSRVKATASAGSVTLEWNDALNADANHAKAAQALAYKFGWHGRWIAGGLPDNLGGYVFVLETGDGRDEFTVLAEIRAAAE